jgi:fucose permease
VSLGLPDGLLGVAWPSIRGSFALPLDALGPLLVASTTGYVLASFTSGRLLARLGLGALLAISCAVTAASLLGYASVPRWWMMVTLGFFAGLGAGAIDAGLNSYVSSRHGARTVNLLHAFYGIGAAGGPVVMTNVMAAGLPWRVGYGVVGAAQLLLAACFAATLRFWPAGDAREGSTPHVSDGTASLMSTLSLPAAWLGVGAFIVYTGLEAVAGAWTYSLLTEARAASMEIGGRAATLFWAGLMLGRLGFGLAARDASLTPWLRACIGAAGGAAMLLSANLGHTTDLAAVGTLGLACGPIFPCLIAGTPARIGERHAANQVGMQVAGAALGQALLPALVGIAAARLGLEVVGPALLAAAVLLLGVHELLRRTSVLLRRPS